MYFGKLRLFSTVAERQMVIPLSSLFAEEGWEAWTCRANAKLDHVFHPRSGDLSEG